MNEEVTKEIDDCITSLVSIIDATNPCFDTFYQECVKALNKEGFGVDTELLTTALRLRSEEHFEITGTTNTRERELYCFRKIRKAFKPFSFQSA
jgi:hypothetical protein